MVASEAYKRLRGDQEVITQWRKSSTYVGIMKTKDDVKKQKKKNVQVYYQIEEGKCKVNIKIRYEKRPNLKLELKVGGGWSLFMKAQDPQPKKTQGRFWEWR